MKIAQKLAEFLYPPDAVCHGCGDPAGADHDGLCSDCEAALEKIRAYDMAGRCVLCMAPSQGEICESCGLMSGVIGRAGYAFPYEGPAANIVRRFKYSGAGNLSVKMAEDMLNSPAAEDLLKMCDVIVCAPADRFRKSRRGYNQAYLLARAVSARTGVPMEDALERRPFARRQARLGRQERLNNLTGVIFCRADLSGRRVLLIDDVRTTGATAAACARALKGAGAAQVNLLTYCGVEMGQ